MRQSAVCVYVEEYEVSTNIQTRMNILPRFPGPHPSVHGERGMRPFSVVRHSLSKCTSARVDGS